MRRRLIWLLVAPLAAVATECAHWAAYRLAETDGHACERLLAATGHGYLDALPLAGGVAGALVLAALGVQAAAAARGDLRSRAVAGWPFALVPPLAFAIQEHVERLVHDGTVPLHAYADRTFAIGLALQVPFGIAAWLLARLVLAAAHAAGAALGGPAAARRRSHASACSQPARALLPRRRPPLALALADRAPPLHVPA